ITLGRTERLDDLLTFGGSNARLQRSVLHLVTSSHRCMCSPGSEGAQRPIRVSLSNSSPSLVEPDLRGWQIGRERLVGSFKLLCQGTFGPIYQGQLAPIGEGKERPVVLKELNASADRSQAQQFLARGKFHVLLGSHPNIVEFLGSSSDRSPLYLVLGHMNRGCLLHFLWTCRKVPGAGFSVAGGSAEPYRERWRRRERRSRDLRARHVGRPLQNFLHSQGLVHGDVAARNLLIQDDLHVRLTGLQIPFEIQRLGLVTSHHNVPLKWQAPETLMRKPLTPYSDTWSFGVLLYELITLGSPPYPDVAPSSILQYLQRGRRMPQPPNCKSPLYSVMKQCWQWRFEARPSALELRKRLLTQLERANNSVVLRVATRVEPEEYHGLAGTWALDYTVL
ncbi:tyrosine-protein kinase STYK1-like, partial [Rhincodon typus]|uniref:tyrosine-protein kinase STYK1-like n=1 Tax=Rhincodon typus TaxID=259920 RepID=UPI00202E8EEB